MDEFADYAARLNVNYPGRSNRLSVLFRFILAIPLWIILFLINASAIFIGVSLMTVVQVIVAFSLLLAKRYPGMLWAIQHWFAVFQARTMLYIDLLTDVYPWDADPSVRVELDDPNPAELSRILPFFKWLFVLPHYIILIFLSIFAALCVIIAWFAIIITGRYPEGLYPFVMGVARWGFRVNAYAFVLNTDRYPPFSLKA